MSHKSELLEKLVRAREFLEKVEEIERGDNNYSVAVGEAILLLDTRNITCEECRHGVRLEDGTYRCPLSITPHVGTFYCADGRRRVRNERFPFTAEGFEEAMNAIRDGRIADVFSAHVAPRRVEFRPTSPLPECVMSDPLVDDELTR